MALYKTIHTHPSTQVFIWKISESLDDLYSGVQLTEKSKIRLYGMKSELHQRGFLGVRHLLKEAGYKDSDLEYDRYGKPFLRDGTHISITHSNIFSGIILSEKVPVGIDIEKQRDKIVKIARKFTPVEEYKTFANHDALVRKLTIVWGAKEALYKLYGKRKLSFLEDIYVDDFLFADRKTVGRVTDEGNISSYELRFLEFEQSTCVYTYPQES